MEDKLQGFIKQIMLIGSEDNSIQTDLADGITFHFDMDELFGTISFNLPYINDLDSGVDLTKLKKGDTVQLYFNTFESNPGDIEISELVKVFDGKIDNIKLSKTKGSYDYAIEGSGTFSVACERNLERSTNEVNGPVNIVNTILQLAGLQEGEIATANTIESINLFPIEMVRAYDTDSENLFVKTSGGNKASEEFQYIRKSYAIIIHQSGDGYINVMTPTQLLSSPDGLNLNSWQFRLEENMFEFDYGELTNDVNCVICLGRPPVVGYAVDPVAVQLNAGSGVTPGPQHYNYISIEQRDIISEEDAETVAKNHLLELERTYYVQFKTLFNPSFMVGQPVTVYDNDKFPDGKTFFIKRYEVTINKTDVSCIIQAYANSLTVLPEDLVIESTGIADVDVLDVQNDVQDATGWNSETGGFN